MKLSDSQMQVIREYRRRAEEANKALRDIILAAVPSPYHEIDMSTGIVTPPPEPDYHTGENDPELPEEES